MSSDRIDPQTAIASNLRGLRIQLAEQGKKIDRMIDLLDGDNASPGLKTRVSLLESFRRRVIACVVALFSLVAAALYGLVHALVSRSHQ